ncbi:MAG: hypothetical protein IJ606_02515 [Bacteroidaceae bacterium]|nr:hypothetical protein [Bacteroidaceae bacterium]
MELLLYHLIDHIRESMPSVSLVDEDYGQLEAIDKENMDTYPVTFPCVLIDIPETDWSNLSGKSQKGRAKVNVRLVIDCYDDTHYGSGTMETMLDRSEMVRDLHHVLQCFRPDGDGELVREKSRFYTWSHGIKVYEMLYSVSVTDIIPETTAADVRPRVSISVQPLQRP